MSCGPHNISFDRMLSYSNNLYHDMKLVRAAFCSNRPPLLFSTCHSCYIWLHQIEEPRFKTQKYSDKSMDIQRFRRNLKNWRKNLMGIDRKHVQLMAGGFCCCSPSPWQPNCHLLPTCRQKLCLHALFIFIPFVYFFLDWCIKCSYDEQWAFFFW